MKIKKERKQIGGAWVDLEIHYDTKLRHFHMKGLPSDFATFSPSWKNGERASTEKELSDHYYTCSREYVKNKESRKKVIIFIASASSQLTMNKVGTGSYSGSKSKN